MEKLRYVITLEGSNLRKLAILPKVRRQNSYLRPSPITYPPNINFITIFLLANKSINTFAVVFAKDSYDYAKINWIATTLINI